MFSLGEAKNLQINATICDNIGVGSEPTMQNSFPQECKKYDKKKAQEAYDNHKLKETDNIKDIIKFKQKEER